MHTHIDLIPKSVRKVKQLIIIICKSSVNLHLTTFVCFIHVCVCIWIGPTGLIQEAGLGHAFQGANSAD